MFSSAWLKTIWKIHEGSAARDNQIVRKKHYSTRSPSGFTLLELLVVVLIIGVLSSIAAPGWLAFVNRQKVNKFNDAVLSVVQEAQQQAKRTKRNYSVSFRTKNDVPQAVVYLAGSVPDEDNWKKLGENLEIKTGEILLGTNIGSPNQVTSTSNYGLASQKTITFDYRGNLPPNADLGANSVGLNIIVAIPTTQGGEQPIVATKRCVGVKTLLGSIQTQQADKCP